MTLARRDLVAAGAVAAAAAATARGAGAQGTGTAGAAAPAPATPAGAGQAPGWYRFKVGAAEVTLIHEGTFSRPLDAGFVRNAELADVQGALRDAFQPTDRLQIPVTSTAIDMGGRLVLVDAGIGAFGPPGTGAWTANFQAAGLEPARVEAVVLSHFHPDHIQGLRGRDGTPTFPNATLMVPAAEWAFWMDDGQMSRAPEAMRGTFAAARRVFGPEAADVMRYGAEAEPIPGLRAVPANGHTPGHTAFVLEGGGGGAGGDGGLLIWSDTTNKPELFVRHPGWHAVFDMDPAAAEASRRRLLDMAAADRLRVSGYHFPFPANGHIARDGDGYAFVPAFWQPPA